MGAAVDELLLAVVVLLEDAALDEVEELSSELDVVVTVLLLELPPDVMTTVVELSPFEPMTTIALLLLPDVPEPLPVPAFVPSLFA